MKAALPSSVLDRVALDIGLRLLTLQLTLNETLMIQGLLNNPKRTQLCLRIDLGREPAQAEFYIPGPKEPTS